MHIIVKINLPEISILSNANDESEYYQEEEEIKETSWTTRKIMPYRFITIISNTHKTCY